MGRDAVRAWSMLAIRVTDWMCCSPNDKPFSTLMELWGENFSDTTWWVLDSSSYSEIMVLLGVGNEEMVIVYKWCT